MSAWNVLYIELINKIGMKLVYKITLNICHKKEMNFLEFMFSLLLLIEQEKSFKDHQLKKPPVNAGKTGSEPQ